MPSEHCFHLLYTYFLSVNSIPFSFFTFTCSHFVILCVHFLLKYSFVLFKNFTQLLQHLSSTSCLATRTSPMCCKQNGNDKKTISRVAVVDSFFFGLRRGGLFRLTSWRHCRVQCYVEYCVCNFAALYISHSAGCA